MFDCGEFVRDIVTLRETVGWTRGQLAASAGVDRKTVENLEQGKGTPRQATLMALRNALHEAVSRAGSPAGRSLLVPQQRLPGSAAVGPADQLALILELRNKRTLSSALEVLLMWGRRFGIVRIRLYRFIAQLGKMVSVESSGHGFDEAERLRNGGVQKFLSSSPLEEADSFLFIAHAKPIFVELNPDQEPTASAMRHLSSISEPFEQVQVREDRCRDQFDRISPYWMDFRLEFGGEVFGKLTCDLENDNADPTLASQFSSLVAIAAPWLQGLSTPDESGWSRLISSLIKSMGQCDTMGELAPCLARELKDILNCSGMGFFTVLQDNLRPDNLILRKTVGMLSRLCGLDLAFTLEDIKTRSETRSMRSMVWSLAAYVASSNQAVRLDFTLREEKLHQQLEEYSKTIKTFVYGIEELRGLRNIIAVPIRVPGSPSSVLGVLMLSEKLGEMLDRGCEPGFSEDDLSSLSRLADQHIANKLVELPKSTLVRNAEFINDVMQILIDQGFEEFGNERERFHLISQRIKTAISTILRKGSGFNVYVGKASTHRKPETSFFCNLEQAIKLKHIDAPLGEEFRYDVCAIRRYEIVVGSEGLLEVIIGSPRYDLSREVDGYLLERALPMAIATVTARLIPKRHGDQPKLASLDSSQSNPASRHLLAETGEVPATANLLSR